jgi:hypothetical protein
MVSSSAAERFVRLEDPANTIPVGITVANSLDGKYAAAALALLVCIAGSSLTSAAEATGEKFIKAARSRETWQK